tara:strand:- start:257 stop:721 length:465 start_codon:yes stop_codon:yes gene_type:complete
MIWIYFSLYRQNKQLKQELFELREHTKAIEDNTMRYYQNQFDAWCITKEKEIRKDSVARSRNIIRGQATEHLAPLMMEEYSLKDYRFLGNPIDFIIYNGLGDVADGKSDTIESIIFLDIKTGKSRLSKIQRRIRDCIRNGNVEFRVYNPDKEKS